MAKLAAKGALFQYESATGPSVWSTVPCVGDFDMPTVGERDEIDITDESIDAFGVAGKASPEDECQDEPNEDEP